MGNKTSNDDGMAIYDISIVKPNKERSEVAAFKSIKASFFNNIVISFDLLIIATNLILIGHTLFENILYHELFMTFQIGVFIIELFGKAFILGLTKYLFEDKEENDLYKVYIRMKTILILLIPIIVLPVSLLSYFIIKLLLNFNLDIYDEFLNREVWLKFLIYTPAIYLFEILFLLNLQFLAYQKCLKTVFFFTVCFIITHITLSLLLLYLMKIGLIGLTISYCLNSFFFYYFSNLKIKNYGSYNEQNYFFSFIPYKENFDGQLLCLLKKKSLISLLNYGEVIIFHFLFLASLFTTKYQLVVNIIYINFYELICAISKGFYYTLKNYMMENAEDTEYRQKYVIFFSFYYLLITFAIFLSLIIFKNILLNIYLSSPSEESLIIIAANSIRIFYPLSLLLSGIRINLNGIVRGMSIALHPVKRAIYISIYIIICWLLCFYLQYEIIGLWIGLLILNCLLIFESIHKAYGLFPIFFHNI